MGWPSGAAAMEGRPESMESWGVWRVLKEAARLLCRHFRLFLPFTLAFYIPLALAHAFNQTFLLPVPSVPPHSGLLRLLFGTALQYKSVSNSLIKSISGSPAQKDHGSVADSTSDQTAPLIVHLATAAVINVAAMLVTASFTLIVAYLYGGDATSELPPGYHTDPIVTRVFKLLPMAFLRMLATFFWLCVLLLVIDLACFGFLIIIRINFMNQPNINPAVAGALFLICNLVVGILTLFSSNIAVLEPENYGIAALRKSPKLVRAGGGTLFGVLVLMLACGVLMYCTVILQVGRAVTGGTLSVWAAFLVMLVFEIPNMALNVYFTVGCIVVYFVCKSRVEREDRSRIPEYQRASSGAHTSSSEPLLYATNNA